jgi:hypothetical protein
MSSFLTKKAIDYRNQFRYLSISTIHVLMSQIIKLRRVNMLIILSILFSFSANSQNFQLLLDPINPFQKQSLFNLSVINSSGYSGQINLKATLKNRRGKVLMTQELIDVISPNESKSIRGQRDNLNERFVDNDFERLFTTNNQLPPMNYVLCVEVIATGELKTTTQECIDYQASDFLNIVTIYPPDEEVIYDPRPQFNWLDLNLGTNYNYQFKLVELKEGQNKNAALRRNNPIVVNNEITSNQAQFPSDAVPLSNNSKYAWQLSISYKGELLSRSEPSTFTYKDEIEYIEMPRNLSYVDITEIESGANLFAVGEFKFKFPSDVKNNLTAELFELKKDKKKSIELNENQFDVNLGVNKFELDLKDQVYLKHLKKYELLLKDSKSGMSYQMTITYVNPDYIK